MIATELSCEYIESQAIFKIELEGPIDENRVIAMWEYIFRHKLVPPETKRFLFDNRFGVYVDLADQPSKLLKLYKKNLAFFKGSRIAVVTRCPQVIVQVLHMQREFQQAVHERFQTLDAATAWLMSDKELSYAIYD
ncbi:MAG: hypothetical protein ACK5IJ_05765 [Mangrovibacterium sp.]